MAMTTKSGLDYFPMDVDFFQDEKIEFVSAKFGMKGENIAIKLLCKIYRNGYFLEWDEDQAILFAKRVGENISHSLVNDIIGELVKRGFFDKSILDSFKVLTSKGIQKRYFEAVKRRKSVEAIQEYLLINVDNFQNVNINSIDVNINPENVNINSQRKGKEKKGNGKESIEDEMHARDNDISTLWIRTFGRNPNLPEQEETQKLIERFGYERVYQIYKEATLKGFKILQTLIDSLDEKGNIKPKENYGTSNGNGKSGATPDELARIASNWP